MFQIILHKSEADYTYCINYRQTFPCFATKYMQPTYGPFPNELGLRTSFLCILARLSEPMTSTWPLPFWASSRP